MANERAVRRLPAGRAMTEVTARLEAQPGAVEEIGIAAITASKLLHDVHRANPRTPRPPRSLRRSGDRRLPPLPFDLPGDICHLYDNLAGQIAHVLGSI